MPAFPPMRQALFFLLQLLWLCTLGLAQAAPAASAASAAIPHSNGEIRQWYNDQVATIDAEDQKWQQQGLTVEQRARHAYEIRHAARLKAREFMQDKGEVAQLQARDREKYGNPDGPTFDYLVEQNRKKGMSGDAAYLDIIGSSARTNAEFNKKFNVQQQSTP
jgi:hypothetical protein